MDDASPPRADTLDDLLRLARSYPALMSGDAIAPDADSFLRQFHSDFAAEDLAGLSAEDVLAAAETFWAWTARKAPDAQIVRIRPGQGAGNRLLGRDILEIAGPDMPFIVRSVMAELADQGASVLAMTHPVVETRRDTSGARSPGGAPVLESMIQIHLEPRTPEKAAALVRGVEATLADVRLAVADFRALKARMKSAADELAAAPGFRDEEERDEAVAFLRWLEDNHFTFLGARDYQYPRDESGAFARDEPIILEDTGLGLLRDPDRYVLRRTKEPALLTPEIQNFLAEPAPVVVAKSSLQSRVHRRVTADYVGVKRYDGAGNVTGERRFIGLFTADAYNEVTSAIPLLRRKVRRVLAGSGAAPGSHNYSVLNNILETLPRDEMFQIGELELLSLALGVLHLSDRPRAKAFVRRDRFNRFVSALIYLPKERFNSTLRGKIGALLQSIYGGRVEAFYPLLGEGPLARVHYLIEDIDRARPDPDFAKLDAEIAALTRTWEDEFDDAVRARVDPARAEIATRFRDAFTAAYRERFTPQEALLDIQQITSAGDDQDVCVRAYRWATDAPERLRCKIYARREPLPLSATLPIFENMGLYVFWEETLKVTPADESGPFWIHDVSMRTADEKPVDYAVVESAFEDAFAAIWSGQAENDGFNKLILTLGVQWRDAALLRALARYRGQTGLDPSQAVQEAALADNPDIARQILTLFKVRFDPSLKETKEERAALLANLAAGLDASLDKVASLDADRALRRIAALVRAIQRTNYYQPGANGAAKSYFSFKIASPELVDLPEPKPFREIWVWSPDVEGVHLRFGPVARGGLRWTDRRDDFRSEILDLVKAQNVKNAIIVPVGSKGGFFPKHSSRDPAENRKLGVAAYKIFLSGLLDITDNVDGDKVIPPAHVVRWDGDDPYLVVAADKGTATFSDIANGVAADYKYWLDDAFASGGSAGYDHKAMGITARGAWEAVKRHFRELGKDIQTEEFTTIGVGDMSGDVFGNGMLLSRKTKLLAAFDHRDIFIDPDPRDLEAAFAERKRLFDKPGSRWKDYDPKLISQGGGVLNRQDKAIPLSAEIKKLTELTQEHVTPAELISALLKAECELIFFGGIGTFIKAAREAHADAADKTNDILRVDAEDVRAKVIGEGANLGVTQAGRIAYARKGGRIDTDAIDNSAGVDTSDHEVNIKILLADAMRTGGLKTEDRDPLLMTMTDEIAAHVLSHNYEQTLALSLAEATAAADLDADERFMQRLETAGFLNRRVETLPTSAQIGDLRAHHLGLTRPELSKILAYAKLDLKTALVASSAPDDPAFEETLLSYFPPQLKQYEPRMRRHRLRREIIATTIADDLVNFGGPTFAERARDSAQATAPAIAIGFAAARALFAVDALRENVNALDNKIAAAAQTALHLEIAAALRRLILALVKRKGSVGDLIARYRDITKAGAPDSAWTPIERAAIQHRIASLVAAGAPDDLARQAVTLSAQGSLFDIADLAAAHSWPPEATAALYHAAGALFGIDRLRANAGDIVLTQHWERLALRQTLDQLGEDQRAFTTAAMTATKIQTSVQPDADWGAHVARDWLEQLGETARPARATIDELMAAGQWTFAKIVLAAASLRALAGTLQRSE